MKETALVIMAAGIGSRFGGGIKQLEPVGPGGEIIMDYSIYDALEAGFDKIIFIIRKDLEKDFREVIGNRIEKIAKVEYAFQELADLPAGFSVPEGRKKPWGTGQAVLSTKGLITGPFLVINADDYYGKEGFRKIHDYMVNEMDENGEVYDMCMGGFILRNTLSDNGTVTRGVCQLNGDGTLKNVTETYEIRMREDGTMEAQNEQGEPVQVQPDQHVSMNMWGLPAAFLDELEKGFPQFLSELKEGDIKSEYLLPKIIDKLVENGRAKVTVLEPSGKVSGTLIPGPYSYMVNIGGAGLDARVCERVNCQKSRGGKGRMLYVKSLIYNLIHRRVSDVRIECDGKVAYEGKCMSVAFGIGRYSGGGLRQTPDAVTDDGLLDYTVVPPVSLADIFRVGPRLFNGTFTRSGIIISGRCRSLTVFPLDGDGDIVEVDGEIIGTLPVKVEILPSQINVLHDYGSTHSARIDID